MWCVLRNVVCVTAEPSRTIADPAACHPLKVGELGVAVFDCLVSGIDPLSLVGDVELGSPSLYRVKRVSSLVTSHVRKVFG